MPLLRDIRHWYGLHSEAILALAYRWRYHRRWLFEITFNEKLIEPEWSAERRRVAAHEYCHVRERHPGQHFVVWRDGHGPDRFGRFLEDCWERQAEYMAAYLLVRRQALLEMAGETSEYIGGVLDVPPHLLPLRWFIWDTFGR